MACTVLELDSSVVRRRWLTGYSLAACHTFDQTHSGRNLDTSLLTNLRPESCTITTVLPDSENQDQVDYHQVQAFLNRVY
jgi:hypothetical protein